MDDGVRLSDDILLYILNFVIPKTLRQLMLTCRMYHHHGARYLVQPGVTLSPNRISSFLAFLDADQQYRLAQLRTLHITTLEDRFKNVSDSIPAKRGILLKTLFDRIVFGNALTRLTFNDMENTLSLHPKLADAVSSLEALQELSIKGIGCRSVRTMQVLRSRLVKAEVTYPRLDGQELELFSLLIPANQSAPFLLCTSQQSLQELSLYGGNITTATHDAPRYPNVHTLYVQYDRSPFTSYYARIFPNLQTFKAFDCPPPVSSAFVEAYGRLLRKGNQEDQLLRGQWSALDCYIGSLRDLYLRGFTCPIRVVKLNEAKCPMLPWMLEEALADAKPQHLELDIDNAFLLCRQDFLDTFIQPSCRQLAQLDVRVRLCNLEAPLIYNIIGPSLDLVASHIVAPLTALTSFSFSLDCRDLRKPICGEIEVTEVFRDQLFYTEEILADWDVDLFARRCREANVSGSLESITVEIRQHIYREDTTVHLGPGLD
ncbi:hypothetical protein C8Q79DRAFT_897130 [Trametes meyenii]|nr:hypothetical protein C8Q79DRAFT_897130 [Trametes meyenii]